MATSAETILMERFGRSFPAGTVLFREGDFGKEMYIIHEGRVRISKRVRDVEKTLVSLGSGEFFGEMAVLNDKPRTATAVVEEDCKLLVISPPVFEAMVRGNSEIAVRLIKKLAGRLEEADAQIENLLHRDNNSRVVHSLAYMAEKRGNQTAQGYKVDMSVNDLAKYVGLEEGDVQSVLDKLLQARLIQLVPDAFIVYNVVTLRKYLEYLEMKEKFGDI
ncbi:MAG: Cyclic AMP receptor protein [Myxococcota bacterium]|nr:Cyclic AMP receptor protein [Myxococcota bacterium]